MSAMDETIRCTYCLEELKYLIEPRRLDCSHVFCKECMSPQIIGDGSFQCPTCRLVMGWCQSDRVHVFYVLNGL